MAEKDEGTLYCSFCGKSQHEVRKLIAGQDAFICDECIALCTIMAEPGDLPPGEAEENNGPGDEGG